MRLPCVAAVPGAQLVHRRLNMSPVLMGVSFDHYQCLMPRDTKREFLDALREQLREQLKGKIYTRGHSEQRITRVICELWNDAEREISGRLPDRREVVE